MRYQVLLGCTGRLEVHRLREAAEEHDGLIISMDGLNPEGDSEQLWNVRGSERVAANADTVSGT